MLPMNKMELTAYRYLGGAGSCFTAFQGFAWLILSLGAAICKFINCGSEGPKNSFKYCFYLTYYYEPANSTNNSTRLNYIEPMYFQILMWISTLVSIATLVISVFTAKAFIQWKNAKEIRKTAFIWTRSILAFSVIELILFVIFASDMVSIQKKDDIKCFLSKDLGALRSSHINERNPAPYLIQLKSNLKTMRKRIRKMKRNLLFLNAVFDENSSDYLKNPFISKKNVTNYVENTWKNMFNNSIREKIRRKSDSILNDEIMKNFVISEHLDLDEVDYGLLKNFDDLTVNKWIKPMESSNLVFGKQFNLSSSITSDDSNEIDKIANLLHKYLKTIDMQTTSSPVLDKNLDDIFRDFLNEIEIIDEHFFHDNDKLNNTIEKINSLNNQNITTTINKNEEIIMNLRNFIDSVLSQNEFQNEYDEFSNQNLQDMINNIVEYLESNKSEIINNEIILNNIKELLKLSQDFNKDEDEFIIDFNSDKSSTRDFSNQTTFVPNDGESGRKDIKYRKSNSKGGDPNRNQTSDYIKELCDNCGYFILAPSIVCMVLSLKTGLVWVLNITVVTLVLYYGSRIKLKRKCKFLPCLSKKEQK